LEQLGGQIGVAALSAQLEKKQPIAALSAMQTTTAKIPSQEKPAVAVLSAEDLAAARLLGKTEAEFLKLKEDSK
ncbi:protease, partial [Salmonella enterica]